MSSAFADDEEGIITDDLDWSGTSFIAFTGVQVVAMMRVNSGAECGAILTEFHGETNANGWLKNATVITATALQDGYRTDDIYRKFFNAITTLSQASGAEIVLASCAPDQEVHYTANGFKRTGNNAPLPEVGLCVPLALAPMTGVRVGH